MTVSQSSVSFSRSLAHSAKNRDVHARSPLVGDFHTTNIQPTGQGKFIIILAIVASQINSQDPLDMEIGGITCAQVSMELTRYRFTVESHSELEVHIS